MTFNDSSKAYQSFYQSIYQVFQPKPIDFSLFLELGALW